MTENQALILTIVEPHQWQSSQLFFKNIFFASSPRKSVNIYNVARMGQNFDDYPGLQQQKSKCAHISRINLFV